MWYGADIFLPSTCRGSQDTPKIWIFFSVRIILLSLSINVSMSLSPYFVPENGREGSFICSRNNWGMRHCQDVPPSVQDGKTCSAAPNYGLAANACVNWNMYYNVCRPGDHNPHKGSISFDHTALAMIAMFQVRQQVVFLPSVICPSVLYHHITGSHHYSALKCWCSLLLQTVTLEGWTDILFLVMDAHSFWSFIVFILVTIVSSSLRLVMLCFSLCSCCVLSLPNKMGYFIIMNVCAVVIATQFSKSMTRQARDRPDNPIGQLCIGFYHWLRITTCRCIRSDWHLMVQLFPVPEQFYIMSFFQQKEPGAPGE